MKHPHCGRWPSRSLSRRDARHRGKFRVLAYLVCSRLRILRSSGSRFHATPSMETSLDMRQRSSMSAIAKAKCRHFFVRNNLGRSRGRPRPRRMLSHLQIRTAVAYNNVTKSNPAASCRRFGTVAIFQHGTHAVPLLRESHSSGENRAQQPGRSPARSVPLRAGKASRMNIRRRQRAGPTRRWCRHTQHQSAR